jgi:hypothetical protein
MKILSLFDYTSNMVRPWLENGHTCVIVDWQHPHGVTTEGCLTKVGADLMTWEPNQLYDVGFAFPPCTHLAGSGARWWKAKGPVVLEEALNLVARGWYLLEKYVRGPIMLENPVGRLSTYWGEPDYYFDPCDYGGYLTPPGDAYTKKTCLWTNSEFTMPRKKPVYPSEGSKMHFVSPGPERQNIRSASPMGFAYAVYEANHD